MADELPGVTYRGDAITNDDPDTDIARFGLDAAPWMPRVIAEMNEARGNEFEPREIMLIEGEAGQLYLVLSWRRGLSGWIEFHKVTELGGDHVRLDFLRYDKDGNYGWIDSVTGELFPGEAPVVVIGENHGNRNCDIELRLIQLKRNTVDITPDWTGLAIRNVVDLDGDGTPELVARHGPAYDCTIGYRGIPVVMSRIVGQFIYACADFPAAYQQWLGALLWDVPYAVPDVLVDYYRDSRLALFLAQTEREEEGIAILERAAAQLTDAAAEALNEHKWIGRVTNWRDDRQVPLIALLEQSRLFAGIGCPLAAAYSAVWAEWDATDEQASPKP